MDEFSAVEAANFLGVTREAVDLAAREGRLPAVAGEGPRRFSREAVEAFHQRKQAQLLATLARSGETPVSVARRVRKGLHSSSETGLPRSFAAKLAAMPVDWRTLFNKAELAAACVPDGGGCRWCRAVEFSAFLGLRPLEYAEARAELFGGPPCEACAPGLLRPFMAVLQARVHGGTERPSAAAPPPSAADRERAREWALQRPVAAAAKPIQDDGGKAMVSRRLRDVRGRLKDARRRGDTRHALALQQQLQALTADASAVDGRPVSSSPGTLRCGHQLAANCSCPRRAS